MKSINELDRNSPIPLYVQLRDLLKRKILNNELSSKINVLSEKNLCKNYKVSQITVRQALKELESEGLIIRIQGKGTFVRKQIELQRDDIIGLIPPFINKGTSYFLSELIIGIKEKIVYNNLVILKYEEILESGKRNLKGIILTEPTINDERIEFLKEKNIPFVVIGRPHKKENIKIPYVDNNNLEIGEILTTHLIETGKRRIGIILGKRNLTVCIDRFNGYKNALIKNKIKFNEDFVYWGDFSEKTGFEGAEFLYKNDVDAVVCADDLIAIGCLKYLKEKKVKIPDEISVVGCNNSIFTAYTEPPLTSVEIFPRKLGFLACEKLIELIRNRKIKDLKQIVKGKLIIRESSFKGE